jgi:hypothetical protein
MKLSGNKRFFPMFIAIILVFGLLSSLFNDKNISTSEIIELVVFALFMLYIGVTNYMADSIEKSGDGLRARYRVTGFNWTKEWKISDIKTCKYDGSILSIELLNGSKYRLKISVNATADEMQTLKIG